MHTPTLPEVPQRRLVTDRFLGYDCRPQLPDGAFSDMQNLSLRNYPLLSTRPPRGILRGLRRPGGLIAKDALLWVDGGSLYMNGLETGLTGLSPGEKQLVSMGAYVLIFPDKRYYNTEDPADCGSLEADFSLSGTVRCQLCDAGGAPLPDPSLSDSEPEDPANGALWLDRASGSPSLRQYSQAQALWVELPTVYTRLSLSSRGQLPALFSAGDGVSVSGLGLEELEGEKILYALGGGPEEDDYCVVTGLLERSQTLENVRLRLRRRVPDMDFVCQCGNRLWGCRYGPGEDGRILNEIYASALGDFKNFRQFLGLSTDSWTASVGSDGPWTGAVSYLGRPCFFKEDRIHPVTISAYGAHQLDEIPCRGVQKGSHGSLCLVGESLYYKARDQVCVWQGGFPQSVGEALGEQRFGSAVGGSVDGRYYLSLRGADGAWRLLCYDTALGLWTKEDALHALAFAALEGELYAIDADSGALLALKGTAGEREGAFDWLAETGPLHLRTPDRQSLSRFNLTLSLGEGAEARLWLRYDEEAAWRDGGEIRLSRPGTVTLPVRPRRCDHVRLRLTGRGDMRLHALTYLLEPGSDG